LPRTVRVSLGPGELFIYSKCRMFWNDITFTLSAYK
jgi:hypothetical protein